MVTSKLKVLHLYGTPTIRMSCDIGFQSHNRTLVVFPVVPCGAGYCSDTSFSSFLSGMSTSESGQQTKVWLENSYNSARGLDVLVEWNKLEGNGKCVGGKPTRMLRDFVCVCGFCSHLESIERGLSSGN